MSLFNITQLINNILDHLEFNYCKKCGEIEIDGECDFCEAM